MRETMRFRIFRSSWSSWETLFQEVADFATELGPDKVVSISQSSDDNDGVVTVWYWSEG